MFRFKQEPSSWSHCQCLAKIYLAVVRVFTHAQQVGICRRKSDSAHIGKHSGTKPVILARY